jgi:signal transduction histidine kinase
MRAELAALVVHDLKNALGVLEAQLDSLSKRPDRALARRSHRQCAELRQRFVMFLSVYGAGGEMRAYATDESPTGFLEHVQRSVLRAEDAAALTLGPCSTAPPFWFFDRRLVRMALESALHNALRFARAQVVLDVREQDGYLVFSIDDDGPGLEAADPCEESTGLGTELCIAVANAHGTPQRPGRVTLANRPQGGARFEMWLP